MDDLLLDAVIVSSSQDWESLLSRMKPGAFLLSIGTGYRITSKIEDAGFEIRDSILILRSTGPQTITVAMKPTDGTYVENALKHGVAGLNIDGSRIGGFVNTTPSGFDRYNAANAESGYRPSEYQKGDAAPVPKQGRFPANLILSHTPECECVGTKKVKGTNPIGPNPAPGSTDGVYGDMGGTIRAYDYVSEDGTETVENWVCVPDCPVGRLDEQTGVLTSGGGVRSYAKGIRVYGNFKGDEPVRAVNSNSGGASRFFYNANSDLDLLRYLGTLLLSPFRKEPRVILVDTESLATAAKQAGWEHVEIPLDEKVNYARI